MIRVLNFFCVAVAGLACLALYRVSEQTRIANRQLTKIDREIVVERNALHVLEADWQSVAAPDRIQRLAEAKLGLSDATTVQLSAFELLPRRGEDASLGDGSPIQQASIQAVSPQPAPAADTSMDVAADARSDEPTDEIALGQ